MGLIRITLLSTFSAIVNIIFLISCQSPEANKAYLYRVNVTQLADRLKAHVLHDSGVDVTPLVPPELPSRWYYGIGGICDEFDTTGQVYCRPAFLPSHNLLDVLGDSLRDSLHRNNGSDTWRDAKHSESNDPKSRDPEMVTRVLASWQTALSNLSPSRPWNEQTVTTLMQASVAFIILGIIANITGVIVLVSMIAMYRRRERRRPPPDEDIFGRPLDHVSEKGRIACVRRQRFEDRPLPACFIFALGVLLAMAGGICAAQILPVSAHGLSEQGGPAGPAAIIVLLAASLSFVVGLTLVRNRQNCYPRRPQVDIWINGGGLVRVW